MDRKCFRFYTTHLRAQLDNSWLSTKSLLRGEHPGKCVRVHLDLAPFYCKVEKILEQTAYTLDTVENISHTHRTDTYACRAGGPSSLFHFGRRHSLYCFPHVILIQLQPVQPFPASFCQCCSLQKHWSRAGHCCLQT